MATIAVIALLAFITGLVFIVKTLGDILKALKQKTESVVTPSPSDNEDESKKKVAARRKKPKPKTSQPEEPPVTATDEMAPTTEEGGKDAPAIV